MVSEKISILEQKTEDFESSEGKNAFIQSTKTEWIGFVDKDVTTAGEVLQIMEKNHFLMEYDVLLFGSDIPGGECNYPALLEQPYGEIYALCFRRILLTQTGPYNCFLTGKCNL